MDVLASTTTLSPGFSSSLSFASSFHRLHFGTSRSFLSVFRNPSRLAKRSISMSTHFQVNASSALGACSVLSLLFMNCMAARVLFSHLCLVVEKPSGRWENCDRYRLCSVMEWSVLFGLVLSRFYALEEDGNWGFKFVCHFNSSTQPVNWYEINQNYRRFCHLKSLIW